MAELFIQYGDRRVVLQIADPDLPAEKLAKLIRVAVDTVMGRSERQFAATVEQAKAFGVEFDDAGAVKECQRG